MTTESYSVEIAEEGSGTNKLIKAVEQLTQASNKLIAVTDKARNSTDAAGNAARKAADSQSYLSRAMGGLNSVAGSLTSALGGVASALAVGKLVEYADTYTGISNKLRLVSTDQKVTNDIMNKAFAIAQQTGTEFAGVATTYGKVSQTLRTMGKDTSAAEVVTRTIAQSLQLAGTSAESTKAGLLQFEQGLSAGVLRGEEFNSVVENTPGLALALAAGIKQSGAITVGELRKMAENGELTTNRVIEALQRVAPQINTLASTAIPTVSASFQRLQNAVVKYVGEANNANGFTAKLAGAIDLLANNLDRAAPIAAGFIAILAVGSIAAATNAIIALGGAVTSLTVGFVGLTTAMLANPLILGTVVLALAAGGIAFKTFGLSVSDVTAKLIALATGTNAATAAKTTSTVATQAATTANQSLGQSLTSVAAGTTAAATAAATAAPSFEVLRSTTQGVGQGFQEVITKAPEVSRGFQEMGTTSDDAASKFKTLRLRGEDVVGSFNEAAPAAQSVASALLDVETTGSIAAKSVDTLTGAANENIPAVTKAATASTEAAKAGTSYSTATDAVSRALSSLLPNQNAATAAVGKASESYKAATENVNAYGEKLQSIEDFLSKTRAAQDKLNDAITAGIDKMISAKGAAENFQTSTAGLASSMEQTSSSMSGGGGGSGGFSSGSGGGSGFWSAQGEPTFGSNGGGGGAIDSPSIMVNGNKIGYFALDRGWAIGNDKLQNNYAMFAEAAKINKEIAGLKAANPALTDDDLTQIALVRARNAQYGNTFVQGFRNGGSFMVGGRGGTDSQNVAFRASPNERVMIETPEQVRKREAAMMAPRSAAESTGPRTLVVNTTIRTDQVDQFQRSKPQIDQDTARRVQKAMRG